MIPTLDIILATLFIFIIALVLYLLTETNSLESSGFGIVFMFLYYEKFHMLTIIQLSPLMTLLFSAFVFSLSGAIVVRIIRKIS